MSKDKRKYLSAYIPDAKPKETPKRSGTKDDGRIKEIEDAIKAFNDLLAKQNRDNLDALYNIDMDNMSSSMRRLFQSYEDDITSAQSSIETWANEMEAGFSAVAQWQKTVEDGTISSIASINAKANENAAQITQLAAWQKTADEEIDGLVKTTTVIQATANANGASIEQIVTAVGEDGEVTAASIAAAVSEDESFIELIADKVNISGFVTFESLENDGETTVNGNNILLKLDGTDDDGYTSLSSENGLGFIYETSGGKERAFADINTSVDGGDSDETSRYSLNISAHKFKNENGDTVYSSLKIDAAGRVSMMGQFGVYISTYSNEGYITLDALDCTRITAPKDYDSLIYDTGESYCLCADGIYYNGIRIVDNSKEV